MATRLYVILARTKRTAVVFRRGPSKQVLVLRWDLERDRLEPGQWLKARIYERRCDLSPSGDLLVVFAASWKGPYQSWTAVSRAPYLTALLLWAKGDAWGGGGLFEDERTILLNHAASSSVPPPTLGNVPRAMRVRPLHAGRGEDHPIWHVRLVRDGWTLVKRGRESENSWRAPVWITYDPPFVYRKPQPHGDAALEMHLLGVHEKDGDWHVTAHEVTRGGEVIAALGRSDWADWDATGDLLYAKAGRLYRLARKDLADRSRAREVADLREMRFEERKAPAWATRWK